MNEVEEAVEGLLLNQSLCTSGLSLGDLQACNDENHDALSHDSLLSTLAELAACSSHTITTTSGHVSTTPSKLAQSPSVVVTTHQAFDGDEILSLNELSSCSAIQMGIDQVSQSGLFTSDSIPVCSTGLTALDQPTDLAFLNANNLPSYTMNEVNIGPQTTMFLNTIDGLPTRSSGQTTNTRPTGIYGQVVVPQQNPSAMIPVSGTDSTKVGERTQSFLLVIKNASTTNTDELMNTLNDSAMPSTVLNVLPLASVTDEPLYAVSNTGLGMTMTTSADLPVRTLADTYSSQISLQDLPARVQPQVVVAQDFVDAFDKVDSFKEGNASQFRTTNASQPPFYNSTIISQPNTFYQQMDRLTVQTEAEIQFVPAGVDGNKIEDFGRCVEISTTENLPVEEYQAAFVPALSNRPRDISSDIDRLCETVLAGSDLGPFSLPTCEGLPNLTEERLTNESTDENFCRPDDVKLVTKIINCQRCAHVSQNIIDLVISGDKVCLFVQKQGHLVFLCISELISKKILPSAPVLRDILFAYNVRLRFSLTSDECHYVEHQNLFPLNAYYQPMKIKLEQLITLSNFLCRTGQVYNRKLLEELIATPFHSGIKCAQREAQLKDWINNKIPFESQKVAGIPNLIVVTSDKVKYILLSQLYNRRILLRKHHLTMMSLCKNLEIKMCQLSMTDWKVFRKYAGGRERILIDVEGLLPLCHVFYLFITTLSIQAHRELIEMIKKNPRKKLLESSTEADIVLMNQAVSKEIKISGELFLKNLKKDEVVSMSDYRKMQKKAEHQRLIKKMNRSARSGKSMILPVKIPQVIETADHLSKAKKTFIRVNTTLPAGTYCVDENTLVPADEIYFENEDTTSSAKQPACQNGRKALIEAESTVGDTATLISPEDVTCVSHFKANVLPKQTRIANKRVSENTDFTKSVLSNIADAHANNIWNRSDNRIDKQLLENSDFDVDITVVDEIEKKTSMNVEEYMLANCVIESSGHQKKAIQATAINLRDLRKQLYGSPRKRKISKRKKKLKGKSSVSPIVNAKNASAPPSPNQGQNKSVYSNVIADVLTRYNKVVSNRQSAKHVMNHTDAVDPEEYLDAAPVTMPQISESSFVKSSDAHSFIKHINAINMPDCIENDNKIAAENLTTQICSKTNDTAAQDVANVSQTVDECEKVTALRVNNEHQMIWDKAQACKIYPIEYPIKALKASPTKSLNVASVRNVNASPIKSFNASPVTSFNASPIKNLNVAPIMSLNSFPVECLNTPPMKIENATPTKTLNATPMESSYATPTKSSNAALMEILNASPMKSLNASPMKSLNASPLKSLNASPMKSLNASPMKSLNASPMKSLNASPMKSLNATPTKSSNAALMEIFNASPMKSLNASPLKNLDASPVICKKIPDILLSSSPDVRKICSNTLIVSLSPVKVKGGRTKIPDSSGISHGWATDTLAPLSTVLQEQTTQTISSTPAPSGMVPQESTTQTISSTPAPSGTLQHELTMQTISSTPTLNDSKTNRSSAAKSCLSSPECSPVKHGNSSTDLQSRLAGIDCNDSLQFLASVAEVLTDSADDVSAFIHPPVEASSGEFNHLPKQAKSPERLTKDTPPKAISQTLATEDNCGKVETPEKNTLALHRKKKKYSEKSKSPSRNAYVSERVDDNPTKDCTTEREKDDTVEQLPNAISTKSPLINLLSVSNFTPETNGVQFRIRFKPEALQPIATPNGVLDLRVKKQRDAFLNRFGCFVCRKFEEYLRTRNIDISDKVSLSSPPQNTAATATSSASQIKKQSHNDDISAGSDFKCSPGANTVDKNDENKVRLKSGKRKRKFVKENSDDIVLQPEKKRRRLKRLS